MPEQVDLKPFVADAISSRLKSGGQGHHVTVLDNGRKRIIAPEGALEHAGVRSRLIRPCIPPTETPCPIPPKPPTRSKAQATARNES